MLYDDKKLTKANKSSLDSKIKEYASKKSTNQRIDKWWSDKDEINKSHYGRFLSDKQKISEVISSTTEKKERKYPDKLADFDTEYGVVSIGADKSEADEELVLTILPDDDKDKVNIKEIDPFNKNTYLGSVDEKYDDFRLSDLSFKYDFKSDKIDRIDKYEVDGKVDEEDELLYQEDEEDDKIETLLKEKSKGFEDKPGLEREIEKTKDLKEEKEEKNADFYEKIKKILSDIGKGKIKKMVESEDAISRRNRIYKAPDNYLLLEELRLLLKKIKEKELEEDFVQKIESVDLKLLTLEQLKELVSKLKSLMGSSEN